VGCAECSSIALRILRTATEQPAMPSMSYGDLTLSADSINFLSPAARRRTALTKPTPTPLCSICGKPVALETTKTDSNAEAVHSECYARKIESRKPPNPSDDKPQ
jgi:hypothetical protein